MIRNSLFIVLLAASALALTATSARAQASLERAKELYASASYDEALAMLNSLEARQSEDGAPVNGRSDEAAAIALYRVLCLVAVGRSGEVNTAIDRLVSQYPLYRPPSDELPPRMLVAFSSARLKLLPSMVQQRYAEGKAAFDRGDFTTASVGFKWVLGALNDPDITYLAGQSPLSDIRTLATGFSDLSEKALAPPPSPAPAPTPPAPAPVPLAVIEAPPVVPARDLQRVFSSEDAGVAAPSTIRQNMPRFTGTANTPASGVIELIVDANGAVESARLIEAVHPQYDNVVLSAAKKWKYEPARFDGTPVRYKKLIQVSLASSAPAPSTR